MNALTINPAEITKMFAPEFFGGSTNDATYRSSV